MPSMKAGWVRPLAMAEFHYIDAGKTWSACDHIWVGNEPRRSAHGLRLRDRCKECEARRRKEVG